MLTFQISCKYLWGYSNILTVNDYNSIPEIIGKVLNNYETFLREYNLMDLVDLLKINKKDFHIHGTNFEQLKTLDSSLINEEPIYICCHN